jgi:hypothetical protein
MSQWEFNSFLDLLNLGFKATDICIAFKWRLLNLHDVEQRVDIILHDTNDRHASVVEKD